MKVYTLCVCVCLTGKRKEKGVSQEVRKLRNTNFINLNKSNLLYLDMKIQ